MVVAGKWGLDERGERAEEMSDIEGSQDLRSGEDICRDTCNLLMD